MQKSCTFKFYTHGAIDGEGEKIYMKTLAEIREDLKDIRFYYANQKNLERHKNYVGENAISKTVAEYNKAVCKAPIQLYDLYCSLYLDNNTQEVVAEDRDCSAEYIRKLNKKLCLFLQRELG